MRNMNQLLKILEKNFQKLKEKLKWTIQKKMQNLKQS